MTIYLLIYYTVSQVVQQYVPDTGVLKIIPEIPE